MSAWPGVILTFIVVALLLSAVPGPDTLLVLRAGLRGGRAHAIASALGCAAGSLVWGSAAAVGIATLLERSAAAYEIVKLAGAGYLIFLGARTLWAARRAGRLTIDEGARAAAPPRARMGLFYVAVIP